MSPFLPSLPLTSPSLLSPGPTHPPWGRYKGGGKLGHITLLKAVYFASLSLALSPSFLSLSFFSVSAELLFLLSRSSPYILPHSSMYCVSCLYTCLLSSLPFCDCSGSHVGMTERGKVRQSEREGGREGGRDDLVEEGMSLHAVIWYYFSSSALLFHLSPPHYSHPSEALQQSHSFLLLGSVGVCDGSLTGFDRFKLILFCNPVHSHWELFIGLVTLRIQPY